MAGDPYEILGVPRHADDEQIRSAYRRRAKEEHPDADGGDGSYFCRLNDAYETIRTADRRRAYERERAGRPSARPHARDRRPGRGPWTGEGVRPGGPWHRDRGAGGFRPGSPSPGGRGFSVFDELFTFFATGWFTGGGRRRGGPRYRVGVELSASEASRGVGFELELAGRRRRIDIPPRARDGDVLTYEDRDERGRRFEVEVAIRVDRASRTPL